MVHVSEWWLGGTLCGNRLEQTFMLEQNPLSCGGLKITSIRQMLFYLLAIWVVVAILELAAFGLFHLLVPHAHGR